MDYCLAVDIGASSGRHILAHLENGKMCLREIYRFDNGIENQEGSLAWNIQNLVLEVKNGIKKCGEMGIIPKTVAIDTWGVDYVLLDQDKNEILPVNSYRDSKTNGIPEEIDKIIPRDVLFSRNGIQPTNYNTIYQLFADKKSGKLNKAKYCLNIPAYLSYKLTGVLSNEYTMLTTGALINATTKKIDDELLDMLGINPEIFGEFLMPCSKLGNFNKETKDFVGFDSTVIFCPSHDTASAVAACSVGDSGIYISSGTWSLIGTENLTPILSNNVLDGGFTNEGGINYRYRILKNFMGMWLFQNIRKNLDKKYSYDEMMNMAMNSDFCEYINPNAPEFMAPDNMIEAIRAHLNKPNLPIADVLNSVYHSLAKSYSDAVKTVEEICNKKIDRINIVGGGSKDEYLNSLTEKYTNCPVSAGPVEATAMGNLLSQFMYLDKTLTLEDARKLI